jgi:phage repressor protein C with HTH and peptisase S24 domain
MITLEDVYPWLNKFGTGHIRPSSDHLLSRMRTALGEGRDSEGRSLLQLLKDLACKFREGEEVTEILIECAKSAYDYRLDGFKEAETILVDVVSRAWSDLHRRAVVQWMLGCVLWQSLPARQQAIISWRNSLTDFQQLARQPGLPHNQHVWYQDVCCKLEQSLVEALEELGSYTEVDQLSATPEVALPAPPEQFSISLLPSGPALTQTSDTPLPPGSAPTQTSDALLPLESAVTQTSDILQLFTISEEIPAGDFGPSGIDPFPIGVVEIDRLSINGHPYSIHSTRGRRIINLPLDQKMTVVKVKGDSMDLENITAQDFVLLHRVDRPVNGDIVMAEIVDIDSTATLKLFFQDKHTITLKPHSSNPVHKPFAFKKVNEGFYIRGVVIAVLKPI